jgi:hypothetical protein
MSNLSQKRRFNIRRLVAHVRAQAERDNCAFPSVSMDPNDAEALLDAADKLDMASAAIAFAKADLALTDAIVRLGEARQTGNQVNIVCADSAVQDAVQIMMVARNRFRSLKGKD